MGRNLRDGAYLYDVIAADVFAENGAIDPTKQSAWMQAGMRIVSAERARLRDVQEKQRKTQGDADFAARALRGKSRG